MRMARLVKDSPLENTEQARSYLAANQIAASEKRFVFSFDLEKSWLVQYNKNQLKESTISYGSNDAPGHFLYKYFRKFYD